MLIYYLSVTQKLKEYSSYQKADNRLLVKKICVGLWGLIYNILISVHSLSPPSAI